MDTPGAPAICEALAPVESAGYPVEELKSLATIAVGRFAWDEELSAAQLSGIAALMATGGGDDPAARGIIKGSSGPRKRTT